MDESTVADANTIRGGLTVSSTGEYEVLITAAQTKPPAWVGNWLSLATAPPGASLQLITRHYYERAVSVAADPAVRHSVTLEVGLADPSTGTAIPASVPGPPSDAAIAARLKAVATFVTKHSTELERDPADVPPWYSFVPNVFGEPLSFRDAPSGGPGTLCCTV